MKQGLVQGATEQGSAPIGHPGSEGKPKGDLRIIEELAIVRRRNRNGDNPNLKRGLMFFDFDAGRIVWGPDALSREE